MTKVTFSKLGLKAQKQVKTVQINDSISLEIRQYLPISEKADFVTFVVDSAIDEATGCFSPVRLEVYFGVALAKWYANISFTEKQMQDITKTYDLLEENKIIDLINEVIPDDESDFIHDLVNDTVEDIARYNNSFAGMLRGMTDEAGNLGTSIDDILAKVKDRQGLEVLEEIKNVVGKD